MEFRRVLFRSRRFVADQIQRVALGSGLRISIGRIEGPIYGRMTLRDVRLSDTEGMFADSPELTVAWRPAEWLSNRLQINEFTYTLIRHHPTQQPQQRQQQIQEHLPPSNFTYKQ